MLTLLKPLTFNLALPKPCLNPAPRQYNSSAYDYRTIPIPVAGISHLGIGVPGFFLIHQPALYPSQNLLPPLLRGTYEVLL